MEQYGDMLSGVGVVAYVFIALFVVLLGWWGYKIFKRSKKPDGKLPAETYEDISEQMVEPHGEGEVQIGTGRYQCLCFRKIQGTNVADFIRINKPVGELYHFDTSCPISGNGYIVKEEDGKIVDYDPRQEEYNVKESPEFAWFAISWEIVKRVFFVPTQWYKSSSVWFAAGMMAITFIVSLAVIG